MDIPLNMQTLKSIGSFIKDNYLLFLFGVGMLVLFLFVGHFAELIYAAMKFAFVIVLSAIFVHWKFPGSIHKYIQSDAFLTEFWGTDPKHRIWTTIIVFLVMFIVGAWIFHNV